MLSCPKGDKGRKWVIKQRYSAKASWSSWSKLKHQLLLHSSDLSHKSLRCGISGMVSNHKDVSFYFFLYYYYYFPLLLLVLTGFWTRDSSTCNYHIEDRVPVDSMSSPCVFAYFLHIVNCTHFFLEERFFHQKKYVIKSERSTYGRKQLQPLSTLVTRVYFLLHSYINGVHPFWSKIIESLTKLVIAALLSYQQF